MRLGCRLAIKTYNEQLESVQALIAKLESGVASLEVSGKKYTQHDLATLYKREERLLPLAKRESRGGGIRVRGVIPI